MRSWNHCGNPLICAGLVAAAVWLVFEAAPCQGTDTFDVVSGVLESSLFKGKKPLEKLELAAELVRTNKLKQSDLSFVLLDWADQYLREPPDPTERLQRWAALTSDEKLGSLRIPRDFLNRILLAEHLVARTSYLEVSPRERLELLGKLEQKKLVDWSVFLAYGRLYAGGIAIRARKYEKTTPVESLAILKDLKDDGLIDWHYKVPTEAILAAEALAIDKEYQKDPPARRLAKLRDMETSGI